MKVSELLTEAKAAEFTDALKIFVAGDKNKAVKKVEAIIKTIQKDIADKAKRVGKWSTDNNANPDMGMNSTVGSSAKTEFYGVFVPSDNEYDPVEVSIDATMKDAEIEIKLAITGNKSFNQTFKGGANAEHIGWARESIVDFVYDKVENLY